MIVTELYNGQGLGNQLWSYVVCRTLAADRGVDFAILGREKFKGRDFLHLNFGADLKGGQSPEGGPPICLPDGITRYYAEPEAWYGKFRCDVRDFQTELASIGPYTKIEGYFQSERYIEHRREEIRDWLRVADASQCLEFSDDDTCVINVRGGEYRAHPELLLSPTYWRNAIENMKSQRPSMRFVVVTDDPEYAKSILPEYPVHHSTVAWDYSAIHNAKYLILANTSFAFFPAWTSSTVRRVIAPKYWARHNVSDGYWACAFNLYKGWEWQDRSGRLFSYEQCVDEFDAYRTKHLSPYPGPRTSTKVPLQAIRRRIAAWRKRFRGY